MKHLLRVVMAIICSVLPLITIGHEGHDHGPVTMKSAIEISLKTIKSYTKAPSPFTVGQLPPSWAQLRDSDARIHENGRGYYVVALNNSREAKTIYLKILLDGAIADANYSGNFSGPVENASSAPATGS